MATSGTSFPWDAWAANASSAGVDEELVALGRQVIRDYYQHGHDVEDQERHQLGGNGDFMRQLALLAPYTALHAFNANLIWATAGDDADGDVEAFALLVDRLGSQDAVDDALLAEEPVVLDLRRKHARPLAI
jgi:hypothetical protein